jgi:hypothetical protein
MVALVIFAVLVLIAATAPRYGIDSRNGIGVRRASPLGYLRKLGHVLSEVGPRIPR